MTLEFIHSLREVVRETLKIDLIADRHPAEMVVALLLVTHFIPEILTTFAALLENTLDQLMIVPGENLEFTRGRHLFCQR